MKQDPIIVFMGTAEFGVPTLQILHQHFGIAAVVTGPDKPRGRGLHHRPTPVKACARQLGIEPILQPVTLRDPDFAAALAQIQPDIIVVVAFRIVPPAVYQLARLAAFNLHPSLLPAYRGAAPIPWTIIRGERRTGVTSFLLEPTVDTGPILIQKSIEVPPRWTAGQLHDRLSMVAAEVAVETIQQLLQGTACPKPQPSGQYPLAPKIPPSDYWIQWSQPAVQVCRWIRGLSPLPGARTQWNRKVVKILQCEEVLPPVELPPAAFLIQEGQFIVGCGEQTAIAIERLQLPGRKALPVTEFLKGYRGGQRGSFDAPATV